MAAASSPGGAGYSDDGEHPAGLEQAGEAFQGGVGVQVVEGGDSSDETERHLFDLEGWLLVSGLLDRRR